MTTEIEKEEQVQAQQGQTKVMTKIVKPDAFLCEFDTARWAYLQSRNMEYAFRHLQKLQKKETLDPEKILKGEELLRELSELFNGTDEKITQLVEKIRTL